MLIIGIFSVVLLNSRGNGIEAADDQIYLGCYIDQIDHRLLDGTSSKNLTNLTPNTCVSLCSKRSYFYAGLEQGTICHCGYDFPSLNVRTFETDCAQPCSGNPKLQCGGVLRISVYEIATSKRNNKRPRSTYLGCYKDIKLHVDQRNFSLLKEFEGDYDNLQPDLCDKQCYQKGYLYFGLTRGSFCYCGDQPPLRSLLQPDDKCYSACVGDVSKKCGGKWEFSMYATGITDTPINRNYLGCAKDVGGNTLTPERAEVYMTNSPRRCVNICGQLGYAFGGVENGEKCYCSNSHPDESLKDTDKACDIAPCPGNPVETCGDKERLKVYSTVVNAIPKVEAITDKILGCFADQQEHRILNGDSVSMGTLTPNVCVQLCSLRGFPFAGVENGVMCYCGHQFPSKNIQTSESMCNIPCAGNTAMLCGGSLSITVYETGITRKDTRPRSTYLGCYHDHKSFFEQRNNSLLKGAYQDHEEMLTPDFCDELCYKHGFLYFGMTIGRLCYCGDQKPSQSVRLPEEKCYTSCSGMPYKKCGGNWEFSMYSTGITNFPINGKYLGCLKNPIDNQLSAELKMRYASTNSARRCVNICGQLGYKFSGVENGEYCYCSNNHPDGSLRDEDSKCNIVPCAGDANHNCGDKERIMVFSTYAAGIEAKRSQKYLGCYIDQEYHRLLDDSYEMLVNSLTPELCIQLCFARGYPFAGLENGNGCYCGHHFPSINVRTTNMSCNSTCSGDRTKICGGPNTLSAFATGITVIDSRPRSTYIGCYRDNKIDFKQKNHSLLQGYWEDFDETLTPTLCDELCHKNGFLYFGMTVGNYCYCGDQQPPENALLSDDKCYSNCLGESYYMCGGKWEFSLYSTGISDFPMDNNYLLCIKDDNYVFSSKAEIKMKYEMTNAPRRCVNICRQLGYSYSGVENENQCLCSNSLPPNSAKDEDSACNIALCPGNPSVACGNRNRIKIFRTQLEDSEGKTKKKYLGCYIDQVYHRVLDGTYLIVNSSLTSGLCSDICFERGYPFAGTEYGDTCYCGHYFPTINIQTVDSECNLTCSGNIREQCGGFLRIAVYETGITKINSKPRSTYLGCFDDHKPTFEEKEKSILKGRWEDFDVTLTPKVCDSVCYNHGFLFFGMTIGKFCYCGDQKPIEKDLLPDEKCYRNCSGDILKRCGGDWEFSIYSTGITDSPLNEKQTSCIKNPTTKPLITKVKRKLELTNTPRRCANICEQLNYKYGGVENGETCYCSDDQPSAAALDNNEACDVIPCPGDSSETCGNKERIKIFRTNRSNEKNQTSSGETSCEQSSTIVNGRNVCSEQIVFDSNFTNINTDIWKYAVKMFPRPDYDFVVYDKSLDTIYTNGGKLFIRPKLLSENQVLQGNLNLNNCTGNVQAGECNRTSFSYNILPPIKSGQISTENSFTFRYGVLNMTMKLPSGDWIAPHIRLVNKKNPNVNIVLAFIRGNKNYICNGVEVGSTTLEGGLYVISNDTIHKFTKTLQQSSSWSDKSHTFSLRWTQDYISISVDEEDLFFVLVNDDIDVRELLKIQNHTASELYSFDDEFYLEIGVSVGGITDFPDGCKNNGIDKPWTNTGAKALLRFWEDRYNWHKTWNVDNSFLRIDQIIITAL